MRLRLIPAFALSAALAVGACANPDGTVNVPGTVALGAGALIAGLAIASANDRPRHYGYNHGYYPQRSYGYRGGYGRGYGYRRW